MLDGYEAAQKANGRRDSRHRVEHVEVIHPDDIARFAGTGLDPAGQVLFVLDQYEHAVPALLPDVSRDVLDDVPQLRHAAVGIAPISNTPAQCRHRASELSVSSASVHFAGCEQSFE